MRKFFKGFRYCSPWFVIREFETFSDFSAVIPVFRYGYTNVLRKEEQNLPIQTTEQGRNQKAKQETDIFHLIFLFFDLILIL